MFADSQTLADLEIVRARDGGPSIADLLDRTVTPRGSRRLRERLLEPSSDPAGLRALLAAQRFLSDGGFRFPIRAGLVDRVERYLASNLTTLADHGMRAGRLEGAWVAFRHPESLELARDGVGALREVVRELHPLLRSLEKADPPGEVRRILASLGGLLGRIVPERLWPDDRPWVLLGADSELRGRFRADLVRMLELVADLDALLSGARLVDEGFCLPEVVDRGLLQGVDMWHPFLPEGVRNSLRLGPGETVIFLTGPNMAGKTTYLRAAAVCAYLAHCGLPVPAADFRFRPLDALFTALAPEDSLRSGLSLFMSELLRVRTVLEHVADGRTTLAVFDEVFRGTNVRDALEASRRVIRGCARAASSGFLFSSHHTELARALEDSPAVRFFHFEARIGSGEASFDHALRPGVSEQRLGLALFREQGLDRLLEGLGP